MELELVPKEDIDRMVKNEVLEDVPVYQGPERRKKIRRVTADRRETVRFEEKSDRRSGIDRRAAIHLWDRRDI
jgi:hypothetical protein